MWTSGARRAGAALAAGLAAWAGPASGHPARGVDCSRCPPAGIHVSEPFRPVDFETDFYGLKYRGNSGNHIDLHILMYGAFEKPVLHFMRDVMRSLRPTDGVFVDVGANTGQHALFMARYAKRVHAFEPWEPVLERFRAMIALNALENVVVHPVGLGEAEARLPFYEPSEENLGTGSFVEGFRSANRYLGELKIVVGDRALAEAGVARVDLVKIDVEGYERAVLRGLRDTLESSRPVVVVEITIDPKVESLFRSREELSGAFPERYECRHLDKGGERRLSGQYELRGCNFDFERARMMQLVIYPIEQRDHIPVRGGREPRPD